MREKGNTKEDDKYEMKCGCETSCPEDRCVFWWNDKTLFKCFTENLKLFYEKDKTEKPHIGIIDKINNEYKITRN